MKTIVQTLFFLLFIQTSFAQFITTWKAPQVIHSITIPTNPDYTYDYNVDWGDGSMSNNVSGNASHTYATSNTYTVTITGTFPAIYFNSNSNNISLTTIQTIEQWGNNPWKSMRRAFSGCGLLTINATDNPNLTNVTDMNGMFYNATNINPDTSGWDVGNVTNMGALFYGARHFNKDVSNWNVSNVTDMSFMFYEATDFNQDISSWNVSNVTEMNLMFIRASAFNQDISGWNVGNVTNMKGMFTQAIVFNQDLDNWNVSNVTDMSEMFLDADAFNKPIGSWDVGNVTNMSGMFQRADTFNQGLSSWNVSNVTDMSEMFSDSDAFNQAIGSWDVANVTNMSGMFQGAVTFNQDINNWNVGNVLDMSNMFSSAIAFDKNIGSWNVSNVTDMSNLFSGATTFNQDIGNWNVSNVTTISAMFQNAYFFNQDISSWDVANVNDMYKMFEDAFNFNQDLGNWDVSNVTDMGSMLDNSGLSIANYDSLLTGWASQTLKPNIFLGAEGLYYCEGETARNTLTSVPNNWTITDEGKNCNAITLIPDPNFEQYLIDANIDSDGTINGEVFTTDIENITQVSATGKNITDLTGIKDFTSLETLRVFDNALTTLDVSNNLELKDLRCFNNEITVLDVSKNTKLEDLRAFDNNIETLDLSNNALLETVKVYNNALTSLNVKNGNNSAISTFETTGNLNLDCIDVDDLNFANGNWTDIDSQTSFSLNCSSAGGATVSIPDAYFEDYIETLGAGNGVPFDGLVDANAVATLTSVDLNGLGTVESLSGIEFFTALTDLNVSGNLIELIDVSSNTELIYFDISDNNITSIDVSNNTKLQSLIVSNNNLTDLDVTKLIDLENLRCNSNQLLKLDVTKNTALAELNCSLNSLIILNLLSNINLEDLYCEQNNIEYLDLSQNTSLRTFTCIQNSLVGLNLKNGNNTLLSNASFAAFDNPSLSCIQVDDVSYSNSNWAQIDMTASFSENCTPVNDDCSFTIPLVLGQDTPGDTTSASAGVNNPNCAQNGIVLFDVWYEVAAPTSGSIVLNLSTQPLIAKIAIYESCSDAQPFACDEDTLSVDNLTPGQNYYLQVWLEATPGANKSVSENRTFTLTANDSSVLSVDDFNEEKASLLLYPNPTSTILNVSFSSNQTLETIDVYNLIGKKVISENANNQKDIELNVSNLSTGIYVVKVKSGNKIISKKLVIN
ncbi:MAG: BspA family leucine-rich repeat surface protein [Polaribacter sp.]|uniref:BspA family leucine-rich repeat surface protein n=1 Tax=Polaribacter sp. TaxID=1920175 RepID=UPI003BAECB36